MSVDVDAPAQSVTPAAPHVAWLAWSLTLLTLIITAPMVYLATANDQTSLADNLLSAGILLIFAGMGALVASRRPRNPVGWLLCLVALLSVIGILGVEYAVYGLVRHPGALPAAFVAAIIGGLGRGTGWFYMLTLVPLYFPNGKLVSARWRWIVWLVVAATLALAAGEALSPFGGNIDDRLVAVDNPIGFLPASAGNAIVSGAFLILFGAMLCSACSVVVRFRRARGIERQQLKWFVYAMAIGAIGGACFGLAIFFSLSINLIGSVWFLITVGMPIATGIAILRYRLYDIDIIIKRTLVYGSLTLILAALYFGLVIGAQHVTQAFTGQQVGQQPVVIVLTTLLIAALVQPLRHRLQRWIDRRFYRSRYDAAKTVAAFSATLRSEVDLAQLNEHLLGVVEETMRPTHVSLWLRTDNQHHQP